MIASLTATHLPVLAYHKVAEVPRGARFECNYVRPAAFVAQLRFLRAAGYRSISFADYLAYRNGAGTRPLPPRPILITFDDGYRSNSEIAVPILQRFGFSATFFVVSGLLGRTNQWDPDEIQEPLLTLRELREMRAQGMEIQSHTLSHQRLTAIDPALAFRELRESRLALEDGLGDAMRVIAYPWGDHDPTIHALAADAGYEAGVILRRRTNFDRTSLFALRRIGVNTVTSMARFTWDLSRLRWRGD